MTGKPIATATAFAYLCILFSLVGGLAVSALSIRLSRDIDVQAIILIRMATGAAFARGLMCLSRTPWKADKRGRLVRRSILSAIATQFIYLAIVFLPLATSTCLFHTSPVWTALIGWFFIGHSIKRISIIAMSINLFGAILVSQPTLDVSSLGVGFALAGAILSSCTLLATYQLKDVSSLQLIAHSSIVSCVFAIVAILVQGKFTSAISQAISSPNVPSLLILTALIGCLAQLALVYALQRVSPVIVTTLRLLEIPMALAVSVWMMASPLSFIAIVGAASILLGSALITIYTIPLARSRIATRVSGLSNRAEEQTMAIIR